MRLAIVGVCLLACGGNHTRTPLPPPDASSVDGAPLEVLDAADPARCSDEIRFTQATGCQNDGSVEFCIPANDQGVLARLAAIEPAISCAAGGGRAGCNDPPGLWLCFYPTRAPAQCDGSAMTDDTWQDMCEIAALPEVTEIVPTIFE